MTNYYKPDGFHTVTPYLIVKGAAELIDFMKAAFDAEEMGRYAGEDGQIIHAAVRIGDSVIELSAGGDGYPPRPAALHIYVPDCDETYQRALAAGGASLYEAEDKPYGERSGGVIDPSGNHWYIATRIANSE
jgi:uncharacterized glyoxalase superfamily protein PhnB